MSGIVKLYSLINLLLEKIGFKLDYIGAHRYQWIKNLGIKNLIDVGANKGQTVSKYKKIRNNELNIYSFEPLTSAFSILTEKYGNDSKVKLYKMGLGSSQEFLDINITNIDDSSSLLDIAENGDKLYDLKILGKEAIKVDMLDSIFADGIDGLCMMKVDVQGYELNVLKGGEGFISENVKILILELSFLELYSGQELFDDVHTWLKDRGFDYAGSLEQSGDPFTGRPTQQDSYFINKNI